MQKTTESKDASYALYRPGSAFDIQNVSGCINGVEITKNSGTVKTPHGYVIFYAQKRGDAQFSSVEMIKNGREYRRRFNKYLTVRGLTAKANQFSRELYGDKRLGLVVRAAAKRFPGAK